MGTGAPQVQAGSRAARLALRATRTPARRAACIAGVCSLHLVLLAAALAWTAVADGVSGPRSEAAARGVATPTTPLAGRTIVVDPGHNGRNWAHPAVINKLVWAGNHRKPCDTTGTATNAGYSEAAFTWDVGRRLTAELRRRGAEVVVTRPDNRGVGPCITKRAAIGNDTNADAAISVHADGAAAGGQGFHVIRPTNMPGLTSDIHADSRGLAVQVRNTLRDRGVRPSNYVGSAGLIERGDLGGLNLSDVPKVFVELGNMRNPTDARRLARAAHRQRLAIALADGTQAWLLR